MSRPREGGVLLVRPGGNRPTDVVMPPLGLLSLAAIARERTGRDPAVLDLYLEDPDDRALERRLAALRPSLVGIGAMNFESRGFHRIAATARRAVPDALVVAGGPYPTTDTAAVLADRNVDLAVLGEGEATFAALLARRAAGEAIDGLPGTARRSPDGPAVAPAAAPIEDLDALPSPAWDLVDLPAYRRRYDRMSRTGSGDYAPLFTSRACPYHCAYCHRLFGNRFRARSAASVLGELRALVDRHGVREVEIVDDCFNADLDRAKRIFREIIAARLDLRITFPAGLRGDRLDEEFFSLAARAGVVFVSFALETASERLQSLVRKELDIPRVRRSILHARAHGIFTQGFFMLGFPTETLAEMHATVDLACALEIDAATFLMVTAFENTPLADLARKHGKRAFARFDHCYLSAGFENLTEVPGWRIQRLRLAATARFWASPQRWAGFLRSYPDPARLPHLAGVLGRRLTLRG